MVGDSLMESDAGGLFGGRYDRIAAFLALLLAVAMFPLRFVLSHIYASTFPIVLAVAAVLYLLATRRDRSAGYALPTLPAWGALLVPSLTFFTTSAMVVVAALASHRSVTFFALAAVAGILVLVQVFFTAAEDLRPGVVLFEVLALALVVRFAALYTTPGVIGVDTWSHTSFVQDIMAQNSLSAIGTKYYASPLFHLFAAFTAMLADTSARNGIYLSFGLAYPFLILTVYPITRLFAPVRWALLATALFAINDQAVRWGLTLIPTSMAFGMYLAALYLLLRILVKDHNTRDTALLALLIVGITLTHQVSSFVMLVTLGGVFAAGLLLRSDVLFPRQTASHVLGLLVFNLGSIILAWSVTPYLGSTFTSVMVNRLRGTLKTAALFDMGNSAKNAAASAGSAAGSDALMLKLYAYLDTLPFLLMLAIAVVGALYVLRSDRVNHATLGLVVTVCGMAVFALALPVAGIALFVPGRWFVFMSLVFAVLGALGLGYLTDNLEPRVLFACVAVFLLLYPSVAVVAGGATPDNPLFPEYRIRTGYSATEVEAAETITSTTPPGAPFRYTDDPYRHVLIRGYGQDTGKMVVPPDKPVPHDVTIYREYQSQGAPLVFNSTARNQTKMEQVRQSKICPGSRSKVYTNGDVLMCTNADG